MNIEMKIIMKSIKINYFGNLFKINMRWGKIIFNFNKIFVIKIIKNLLVMVIIKNIWKKMNLIKIRIEYSKKKMNALSLYIIQL